MKKGIVIFLLIICQGLFAQEFIHLEWTPPNDTVYTLIDYKMYRDTHPGTMIYLNNVAGLDSFYYDKQITEGVTYYWKVTAVYNDNVMNVLESGPSNEVSTTIITIVGEDNSDIVDEFRLKQNYPNPFNPVTTINYQVAENTSVTIVVYDVLGKKIRDLVNDYKVIGSYQVKWDGKNNDGSQVSSGIYFYQMTTIHFRDIKKLILKR